MKKYMTVAALLAAGTAFANAATGSDVQDALDLFDTVSYETYELTFKMDTFGNITNSAKEILTLESGYYLITQADGDHDKTGKRYFGLSKSTGDAPAASGWTFGYDTTTSTKTLTSAEGELPLGWITQNDTGTGSQSRVDGDWTGITISYDGVDTTLELTYAGNPTPGNTTKEKDVVVFSGKEIALSGIAFSNGLKAATLLDAKVKIDGITHYIPEPSAFGLLAGIGALALVASRRRRK